MTTAATVNEERLDTLARRIRQGKCILFLGPGVFRTKAGIPFNSAFAQSLAGQLEKENIPFEQSLSGNMGYMIYQFLFGNNKKKGYNVIKMVDVREQYLNFYRQAEIDLSLYEQLVKLPFPLVINANTDDRFCTLYQQEQQARNREVEFDFYDMSNRGTVEAKKSTYSISTQTPLVYNLFGHCSEEHLNSLILSEKEMLSYVGSIHQVNMMLPRDIVKFIDPEKYCLFLGFDFNEWILKIIIRTLWSGETADDRRVLPDSLAIDQPSQYAELFYENEFNICFVNNRLEEFIQTLVNRLNPKTQPPAADEPVTQKGAISILFIFDYANGHDFIYRDHISKQLKPLVSSGKITLWSEDMPHNAGKDKDALRKEKFTGADMVLWLASSDFFDTEKNRLATELAECNKKKHLRNIAILLRPYALYHTIPEMKNFTWQPLPGEDGKITSVSEYEDESETAIAQVAAFIAESVDEINKTL